MHDGLRTCLWKKGKLNSESIQWQQVAKTMGRNETLKQKTEQHWLLLRFDFKKSLWNFLLKRWYMCCTMIFALSLVGLCHAKGSPLLAGPLSHSPLCHNDNVAHLKWGGDRDTLLMLYRSIVRSKLDYGCIVYGTASNTNLRQLDSIHNAGLRLALGSILHQPSLQYVHEGQRSSFGGTSVEVVHELLSENSCLHWQPSTTCTIWIWPNHKRSVSS